MTTMNKPTPPDAVHFYERSVPRVMEDSTHGDSEEDKRA